MRARIRRVDVPLLGFFVMSFAVIGLLIVVAVMHYELLQLRAVTPAPEVTNVQLVTQ